MSAIEKAAVVWGSARLIVNAKPPLPPPATPANVVRLAA